MSNRYFAKFKQISKILVANFRDWWGVFLRDETKNTSNLELAFSNYAQKVLTVVFVIVS